MNQEKRLQAANAVLADVLNPRACIEVRENRAFITWRRASGKLVTRRWQRYSKGTFFPMWEKIWPGGGTSCAALAQLVFWVLGKPTLPLSTWQYWASDSMKLITYESVKTLEEAGYPKSVDCVICLKPIAGGIDWYSAGKKEGPCCSLYGGCKQQGLTDELLKEAIS